MLITPGDLIPVHPTATTIPWTRRKSQILNFLHRGPVTFTTLVYDTNVGDISALSTYFNPERVSVKDLNSRFGQHPSSSGEDSRDDNVKVGSENVLKPRLLLYPEHNLNHSQVKVQRTLKWVLSHQDDSDQSRPSSTELHQHSRPSSTELHHTSRPSSAELVEQGCFRVHHNSRPSSTELVGEQGGFRDFMQGDYNIGSIAFQENFNMSTGSQTMTPASRLTPIGHPLTEEVTSGPLVRGEKRLASTMPNLDCALDSVWSQLPRESIASIASKLNMEASIGSKLSRWGTGAWDSPAETAW